MQAQGSLRDTDLAALLQAMQSERATGTLSLDDGEHCALYFLFGHLFHASGAGGQGEEVVIRALSWNSGTFRFDPRAKLPAEETIKSSPADLIGRAERRQRETAAAGATAEAGASGRRGELPVPEAPAEAPVPATTVPFRERAEPDQPRWERQPAAAARADSFATAATPAYAPAERAAPVREEPSARPTPAPAAPAPEPRPAGPSTWQPRTVPAGPIPTAEVDEDRPVGGAPDAPPLDALYPLPAGKKQYEGLKSAFVDFPKLLRTLRSDRHTGYVRLQDSDYSGSLLLHEGELLEALSSNGGIAEGEQAFGQFRRRMDEGRGLIDVIELPADTVIALAQLLTARPLFTGLLGRFVDFGALLEYLAEEKVDGSVVVAGGRETGVILLRGGAVLGAYTASARQLDTKTNLVAGLAKEPPARIEVKSGAGEVDRMDFEASLNRPY